LFDFDKAALRADAKNELDPLVNRLKGDANLKSVEVAGHTDYLGSEKYNQALSQKRADAVKNYFVAAGVPAEKVSSVGKGETEAKLTEECKTKKLKKKADRNACLEGDRRVELTIDTFKESVIQK
ncbi:MAG: OmpA family protein, partial [Pseudogulbenkiania sp.]|nr:OmpA family protein [Pseudogulbenkiania sp.]